jgi:hypothetical protein
MIDFIPCFFINIDRADLKILCFSWGLCKNNKNVGLNIVSFENYCAKTKDMLILCMDKWANSSERCFKVKKKLSLFENDMAPTGYKSWEKKQFYFRLKGGWSSQNEALEPNFPNFISMTFLWKYGKLRAFWYSFYFDTWLGKHFLMSTKIFRMKKIEISWFLEI